MGNKKFDNAPPHIVAVANYLLGSSDLTSKSGILNGKRIDFFKGKHGANAILRSKYHEKRTKDSPLLPHTKNYNDAKEIFNSLLELGFIYPVHRLNDGKTLRKYSVQEITKFSDDDYYVWVYQTSQLKNTLLGILVLLIVFIGVLSPLWPSFMKIGTYYLSVGILGILLSFFALAIVRLILYVIVRVVIGRELWLFPNLFADVGFFESFVPLFG